MSWILILTLLSADPRSGASIASVPGFQTKEACMTAGSEWLKQTSPMTGTSDWNFKARAVCVPNK